MLSITFLTVIFLVWFVWVWFAMMTFTYWLYSTSNTNVEFFIEFLVGWASLANWDSVAALDENIRLMFA